jgi:hypothetical protein
MLQGRLVLEENGERGVVLLLASNRNALHSALIDAILAAEQISHVLFSDSKFCG